MIDGLHTRLMTDSDWPVVERIYAEGIATGHATFEKQPPSWEDFDSTRVEGLRRVAVDGSGVILGWVAASRVSTRQVYRGVVEHSIYIAEAARGGGVGRLLLTDFIAESEDAGVWTIQSGVFPENLVSLALHAALGFRFVGVRKRIGLMEHGPMAGQWRDNVFIERRSRVTGATNSY